MTPAPDDVGTTRMYGSSGPTTTERIGSVVGRAVDGIRDPDDAQGWVGILLPAIVTGLAIEIVRRWV